MLLCLLPHGVCVVRLFELLRDVYAGEFKVIDHFHSSPVDEDGDVSSLVPPVFHKVLCFVNIEGEVVYLAPRRQSAYLLPIVCLISVGNQCYCCCEVSELEDGVGGHTVVGIQEIQEGTEDAPLWGPRVENPCRARNVAYLHHLGVALQEVQDPVA